MCVSVPLSPAGETLCAALQFFGQKGEAGFAP